MNEKVLFVDDEPEVIEGYKRMFRRMHKPFRIDTATSAKEGLRLIEEHGPYAVIVSDMRMLDMNGIEFLSEARKIIPEAVRIMITGYADKKTAIDAVNEGKAYLFLEKPCPTPTFAAAIDSALELYHKGQAEKDLLENTLTQSIRALCDVLALVNPLAFGIATRISRLACQVAADLKVEDKWQVEVAALLSQIGCIVVPQVTLMQIYKGGDISSRESECFRSRVPIGRDLLMNIPRLEKVSEIIGFQESSYRDLTSSPEIETTLEIARGAQIIKVASDFDLLTQTGHPPDEALKQMARRVRWYDPAVIASLQNVLRMSQESSAESIRLDDLAPGMIVSKDVQYWDGRILLSRGQEITPFTSKYLENVRNAEWEELPSKVSVETSSIKGALDQPLSKLIGDDERSISEEAPSQSIPEAMTLYHLPPPDEISDCLSRLLGKNVIVEIDDASEVNGFDRHIVTTMVGDGGALGATLLCDPVLGGSLGASLAMLPSCEVDQCTVESNSNSEIIENLCEVLDVTCGLFNSNSTPRLKMHTVQFPSERGTGDSSELISNPAARLDLKVTIPDYCSGAMTCLVA